MKTTRTVVAVDTAKRVFQLHWIDMETRTFGSKQLIRLRVSDLLQRGAERA